MKIFLKIISLLIIIALALIASLNLHHSIDFSVWSNKAYSVDVAYIILTVLIAGITAGFTWVLSYHIAVNEKLKEYQRKLEKTSVSADSDSSKVAVLEAKIEVLEKALKSALEKN